MNLGQGHPFTPIFGGRIRTNSTIREDFAGTVREDFAVTMHLTKFGSILSDDYTRE